MSPVSKVSDALGIFRQATIYSFKFCWNNSKKETVLRIILSIFLAAFSYMKVYATGGLITALQNEYASPNIVESFVESESGKAIFLIALILFLGIILGRANWFYRSRWYMKLRFTNNREIFGHRATLDVACYRSKKYDDLTKQIEELPGSWNTRIGFSEELFNFFGILITFVVFGTSILFYSPVYGIIIFALAIPMMVSEFQVINKWWRLYEDLVPHNKARTLLEKAYKGPLGFLQMLMWNQHKSLKTDIGRNHDEVIGRYDAIRAYSVKREIVVHTFSNIGLICVIIHAVWSMRGGGGDLGKLVVLITSANVFQGSLEGLVSALADQWNSAKGVILIEKDYFGLKPLLQTQNPVRPRMDRPPVMKLSSVNFAYPDTDVLVLKNINLTIEPGMKLAIVGKSGSGKTSLQGLLMRHYDPTAGNILVDDINLRSIRPKDWSCVASSLTQKFSILERKVRDEIASSDLAKPVDMEVVASAARFANFAEVAEGESQGYLTQIGTEYGGKEFSGGEERRLALARVKYRETPILILDEPDTGLDPETAQQMMDNVFALTGITLILITHHVSRAERCDQIIVLEKGEIIDRGTHAELMARRTAYAKMFDKDKKRLES